MGRKTRPERHWRKRARLSSRRSARRRSSSTTAAASTPAACFRPSSTKAWSCCCPRACLPLVIENAAKQAGMPVGPLALVTDEVTLELPMKIVRPDREPRSPTVTRRPRASMRSDGEDGRRPWDRPWRTQGWRRLLRLSGRRQETPVEGARARSFPGRKPNYARCCRCEDSGILYITGVGNRPLSWRRGVLDPPRRRRPGQRCSAGGSRPGPAGRCQLYRNGRACAEFVAADAIAWRSAMAPRFTPYRPWLRDMADQRRWLLLSGRSRSLSRSRHAPPDLRTASTISFATPSATSWRPRSRPHAERWREAGMVDREVYAQGRGGKVCCAPGPTSGTAGPGSMISASSRSSSRRTCATATSASTSISTTTSSHRTSPSSATTRRRTG